MLFVILSVRITTYLWRMKDSFKQVDISRLMHVADISWISSILFCMRHLKVGHTVIVLPVLFYSITTFFFDFQLHVFENIEKLNICFIIT